MRKLTKTQFAKADSWMQAHARPYDLAKWNYLFHNGSKEEIVKQITAYQNADGGFGSGFEADVLCPLSGATPTADAIFLAYDYQLDCSAEWFQKLLGYFEHSVKKIAKYWEDVPPEVMDYPHAPWWNYEAEPAFSPNPCAVVASALICHGTPAQKELGTKVAEDCFRFLLGSGRCDDHGAMNLQYLAEKLIQIHSPLVTDRVMQALHRRIIENTCFDTTKYHQYYFTPLDFVSSPDSLWYDDVRHGIEPTFEYWFDHINEQGVWDPHFSWGVDSDASRQATENWKGHIAVKRARILRNFDRIET